jgi:hypothetical protein
VIADVDHLPVKRNELVDFFYIVIEDEKPLLLHFVSFSLESLEKRIALSFI